MLWKIGNAPRPHNDIEHSTVKRILHIQLTFKRTLHTLSTYPRGPNFSPFCSTTSSFRDTRLLKIEKSGMHQMTSE